MSNLSYSAKVLQRPAKLEEAMTPTSSRKAAVHFRYQAA